MIFTSPRLEWCVQGGKPCYIQIEESARNKTMRSRRESYKYRRWFMMAPDQRRISSTRRILGILLARVCTMKDLHKVMPIYGLTIGGL